MNGCNTFLSARGLAAWIVAGLCVFGCIGNPCVSDASERALYLVSEPKLLSALGARIPSAFHTIERGKLRSEELISVVSKGGSLVWIGSPEGLPAEFWVGSFEPADSKLGLAVSERSPLPIILPAAAEARVFSAFIKPPKEMPYHNIDEEILATFQPILEARDRFGQVVGYPGVCLRHVAPSTVKRRFMGSECYFFFQQVDPGSSEELERWKSLLDQIALHFRSGVQLTGAETDYASYEPGERVRAEVHLRNSLGEAVAVEVRFLARAPGDTQFRRIVTHRRVADGGSAAEAVCDFLPESRPGLWTLQVEVAVDPDQSTNLAVIGKPVVVDRSQIGFVVQEKPLRIPQIVGLDGPRIRINGEEGFWTGTHYYPSSSWWDWQWRDFRPLQAKIDFTGMRQTGYRIVRLWIDPVLDEQTLRAMDAAIFLASREGLVLDICIFNQWTREIGFERKSGENVRFEFRGPGDFNILGVSFRNLDRQREYVQVLAKRWKEAGNIIFNLSNETFIRDPDPSQMDEEAQSWNGIPEERGVTRDSLLFRSWANEMSRAIREAGAAQPIIPGYMFSLSGGGDSYQANRDGNIAGWHGYFKPEDIAATLQYFDPACGGRPVLLEEFGTVGWNDAGHYDAAAHYALAGGAAAALSYEWGVSWLSRWMDFYPTPLREIARAGSDERYFGAIRNLAAKWSDRSAGLHPAPSGFTYGSVYHGTPFPAAAAVALARLGAVGGNLGRGDPSGGLYVVVPEASNDRKIGVEPVTDTFKKLWKKKVAFDVLQEDCLEKAAGTARVLIIPTGVKSTQAQRLVQRMAETGVKVFSGADGGWESSPDLPRISVTPDEGIRLLTRRTTRGTLYSLFSDKPVAGVAVRLASGRTARFDLDRYGLVLENDSGIALVEAAGEIEVDGARLCHVQKGRVLLAAPAGRILARFGELWVMASEPTEIRFSRSVGSITVFSPGSSEALGVVREQRSEPIVRIDSQLARYLLRVELQ